MGRELSRARRGAATPGRLAVGAVPCSAVDPTPLPPPGAPIAPLPPEERRPRRRRTLLLVAAGVVVVVGAVLAVAVFEVQTLFTDDEVAEAGPVFESGAVAPPMPTTGEPVAEPAPETTAGPDAPTVTVVSSGPFVDKGHPGEGTARLLTDGTQTFVRFEDDFSTDNGPDLRVRVVVGGEHVDLGVLKGNRGAQNYELPRDVDPAAVTTVDVWCRRFDYVFTEATLA